MTVSIVRMDIVKLQHAWPLPRNKCPLPSRLRALPPVCRIKILHRNPVGNREYDFHVVLDYKQSHASRQALERRVKAIEAYGGGIGWTDGDFGHGKTYQFRGPDGHLMELYYETEKYQPPEHLRPALKNQPQKNTGHGAAVRHLDHINFLSSNVKADGDFMVKALRLRLTEQILLDSGRHGALWYRAINKSYDVVYSHDALGAKGRLHHIAFSVDTFASIARAADIFVENGVKIEFAPSKHAINQTYFVYVIEPGGNRIEICAGGYLVLEPDFEPRYVDGSGTEEGPSLGKCHRFQFSYLRYSRYRTLAAAS